MTPNPLFIPLVGLLVGGLVSLTGLGGGVALLPLLILVLGVPAACPSHRYRHRNAVGAGKKMRSFKVD